MNIKGLLGAQIIPSVRATEKVDRAIHSDMTHDRDANGQQLFDGGQGQQKEPMSEEQMEKALESLRNLPAVKEHKWTVQLMKTEDQKRSVVIKDNLGNVIRRIPEQELWSLSFDDQAPKGHLFKKTA